ncbi:hypothetical protein J7337_004093 [Fusarium musae]|uniref:Uncharacterized protein n=1 Tax=Fusarium musae TaxID=1042133 RepID=A0A9P8DL38_9HYPO|nr:hypothetical protein J7337_004093 [Fusarium musae]KAG9504129.1 hypothetical protein J7337_004093 [Fusarium musae]
MRDGFAFRRSMPANRQKNERVEPRFTRWPVEVQQVIVTTQDGQPPKDELRYPGEGEWERVWNLSDVENLYDMGLWDNLVDIFVRDYGFGNKNDEPNAERRRRRVSEPYADDDLQADCGIQTPVHDVQGRAYCMDVRLNDVSRQETP